MDLSKVDPNAVALVSALIGAIVGAIVTLSVSELLARRRERRDEQRAAAALMRDEQLTAIEQTQRMFAALLADLGATAAGPGATPPGRYSSDVYPKAELALVGDVGAIRQYLEVATDLAARTPGSGLRASDAARMAIGERAIHAALDDQAARARVGVPLRTLSGQDRETVGISLRAVMTAIVGRHS